jgi:hypothetical protein
LSRSIHLALMKDRRAREGRKRIRDFSASSSHPPSPQFSVAFRDVNCKNFFICFSSSSLPINFLFIFLPDETSRPMNGNFSLFSREWRRMEGCEMLVRRFLFPTTEMSHAEPFVSSATATHDRKHLHGRVSREPFKHTRAACHSWKLKSETHQSMSLSLSHFYARR